MVEDTSYRLPSKTYRFESKDAKIMLAKSLANALQQRKVLTKSIKFKTVKTQPHNDHKCSQKYHWTNIVYQSTITYHTSTQAG